MEALANETAKIQFIRYGILNVQDEFLGDYIKNMLSDEKTINELYQQTVNRKIIEEMKQAVDVEEKEITSKELSDMLEKEGEKEKKAEKETEIKAEIAKRDRDGDGDGNGNGDKRKETESLKSKEAKATKEEKAAKEGKEGKEAKAAKEGKAEKEEQENTDKNQE